MDQRLSILARHHRRMLEILSDARPLLASSSKKADLLGLSYLRTELVEMLAAYRRFVRDDICLRMSEASLIAQADADELQDICNEIDAAYEQFGSRWQERNVAENWTEYRLSAQLMMRRMVESVLRSADLQTRWSNGVPEPLLLTA